jgi:hypothetical protein
METKNDRNLFIEFENEKAFCHSPPSEMQSFHFMRWRFIFHFKVSVFMTCPFF